MGRKKKTSCFFEEIQLLINSKKINENVAYYLFGYYAIKAKDGENFCVGMDMQEKYFGLFFTFEIAANKFLCECEKNPDVIQKLKFSID